uniref:Uncharacterized protein n=1 Tax=Ralstonia solanacearum TaxID=305 RepID=A0A0S4WBU6_RALSL|nr:protein of unknown function [Ralstonia solanacearum]
MHCKRIRSPDGLAVYESALGVAPAPRPGKALARFLLKLFAIRVCLREITRFCALGKARKRA